MDLQDSISLLIIAHAAFGGIALLAGFISIVTRKGKQCHKASGKTFFYSMFISAVTALVIAVMPKHENPFLFVVGVFSLYLILTGKRALRFKRLKKSDSLFWDKCISIGMLLTGLGMTTVGLIYLNTGNMFIVLTVFGVIGVLNALQDLRAHRDRKRLRNKWLPMHIGKITGGYIAAFTAFVVVNSVFPMLINWLLPTVLGSLYITYWIRKVSPKKQKEQLGPQK